MNCAHAVSYTHLDVYKRQLEDCERDLLDAVAGIAALGEEKAKLVWEDTVSWEELVDMDAEEIYPVSYTHLDVYKRQDRYCYADRLCL